jgi:hypothetical protein
LPDNVEICLQPGVGVLQVEDHGHAREVDAGGNEVSDAQDPFQEPGRQPGYGPGGGRVRGRVLRLTIPLSEQAKSRKIEIASNRKHQAITS